MTKTCEAFRIGIDEVKGLLRPILKGQARYRILCANIMFIAMVAMRLTIKEKNQSRRRSFGIDLHPPYLMHESAQQNFLSPASSGRADYRRRRGRVRPSTAFGEFWRSQKPSKLLVFGLKAVCQAPEFVTTEALIRSMYPMSGTSCKVTFKSLLRFIQRQTSQKL